MKSGLCIVYFLYGWSLTVFLFSIKNFFVGTKFNLLASGSFFQIIFYSFPYHSAALIKTITVEMRSRRLNLPYPLSLDQTTGTWKRTKSSTSAREYLENSMSALLWTKVSEGRQWGFNVVFFPVSPQSGSLAQKMQRFKLRRGLKLIGRHFYL